MRTTRTFSEYEVKVIQELSINIVPKLHAAGWQQKTTCELNDWIRDEVFDEFVGYAKDRYYVPNGLKNIGDIDWSAYDTSDLDEIDAFCEEKLFEIGFKVLPKFKAADYDTLIEVGIQGLDLFESFNGSYEEYNRVALEIDKEWHEMDEDARDKIGWVEFITKKLDNVRDNCNLPTAHEKFMEEQRKKEIYTHDVAYTLVQLTEDFSKDLYEKYDKTLNDTVLRGEFLLKMAQDIVKSAAWKDSEKTAGEVIENAIKQKKDELLKKQAKYSVGDEVYHYYYDMEKFFIKGIHVITGKIYYDLGYRQNDNNIEITEVEESRVFPSVQDFISTMQCRLDCGDFDK